MQKGQKMSDAQREKIRLAMNRPKVKKAIAKKMVGNRHAAGYRWSEDQKGELSKALKKYHRKVKVAVKALDAKPVTKKKSKKSKKTKSKK